ncbi:thymidylate synthase [Vibrio phage 1.245.O._10N.261.54.C7]|uniref:thymidylate synthase n=1 Tax=Vibrio phage 1.245.O._10N.261.54.C7 TaxID=1881236 RepID=A0A2I7RWE5_9CAUD|nr:thymidylate synthase [Vibrio phage 1.245.O._10N.261.54.C7]AUR97982.1 thymidylate synthase [Vibrio phage 1.245.O._10N.261.54.C7]
MKSLKELGHRILTEGVWIGNQRTGKKCLTIPTHIECFSGLGPLPIDTTRKQMVKAPIMELIGYLRGYTNAQDFADIGSPTWFANANETKSWLDNPNRIGDNDCGAIYQFADEMLEIYRKLSKGIDDRGLIATAWKPETFDKACLRPCMFQHQFQLVGDTLHLTSIQRSADVPMAGSWNSIQSYALLNIMAQVTGLKVGTVTRIINHAHIYEDQYELFKGQMEREEITCKPELRINIDTYNDIFTCTKDDFVLTGYEHHPAIKYPFTS